MSLFSFGVTKRQDKDGSNVFREIVSSPVARAIAISVSADQAPKHEEINLISDDEGDEGDTTEKRPVPVTPKAATAKPPIVTPLPSKAKRASTEVPSTGTEKEKEKEKEKEREKEREGDEDDDEIALFPGAGGVTNVPVPANVGALFVNLITRVVEADPHLVDASEAERVRGFLSLTPGAQSLYVRLYLRKGPWFRLGQMVRYGKDAELREWIEELARAGMVSVVALPAAAEDGDAEAGGEPPGRVELALRERLELLARAELLDVARAEGLMGDPAKRRKVDQLASSGAPRPPVSSMKRGELVDLLVGAVESAGKATLLRFSTAPPAGSGAGSGKKKRLHPIDRRASQTLGVCARVEHAHLLRRLQMCYLLADHDLDHDPDNTEVRLAPFHFLVTRTYCPYQVGRAAPVFATREDSVEYCEALIHERRLETTPAFEGALALAERSVAFLERLRADPARLEAARVLMETRPHVALYTAGWVHWRAVWHAMDLWESKARRGTDKADYKEAVRVLLLLLALPYSPSRRGKLWDRLTTDLCHLREWATALEACWSCFTDPAVSLPYRVTVQERARGLFDRNRTQAFQSGAFKLIPDPFKLAGPTMYDRASRAYAFATLTAPEDVHVEGVRVAPGPSTSGFSSVWAGDAEHRRMGVEDFVVWWFSRPEQGGWRGLHSEGRVWTSLLALIMHPVLFAEVPDMFHHPYQDGPLDLRHRHGFLERRADAYARQRSRILAGEAEAMVREAAHLVEGAASISGLMQGYAHEDLCQIARGTPPRALAAMFESMLAPAGSSSSGLPDVVLWNGETTRLLEVKGPGDRLSDKQRVWIDLLTRAGMDCRACYVTARK